MRLCLGSVVNNANLHRNLTQKVLVALMKRNAGLLKTYAATNEFDTKRVGGSDERHQRGL